MLDDGTLIDTFPSLQTILWSMVSNPAARRAGVKWSIRNLDKVSVMDEMSLMYQIVDQSDSLTFDLNISRLFSSLSSKADLLMLKKVLESHHLSKGNLQPVYEAIEVSASWLEGDGERIAAWLASRRHE